MEGHKRLFNGNLSAMLKVFFQRELIKNLVKKKIFRFNRKGLSLLSAYQLLLKRRAFFGFDLFFFVGMHAHTFIVVELHTICGKILILNNPKHQILHSYLLEMSLKSSINELYRLKINKKIETDLKIVDKKRKKFCFKIFLVS